MTKDEYTSALRLEPHKIVFTKADGADRTLNGTLQEGKVPEPSEFGTSSPSDVVAVWDLDINAWRSFRVDSVKSFEAVAI
jgi:hypothetical protein